MGYDQPLPQTTVLTDSAPRWSEGEKVSGHYAKDDHVCPVYPAQFRLGTYVNTCEHM